MADFEEEEEMLLLLMLYRRYRSTREWVHEINKERPTFGEYHHLYPKLREDERRFFTYFRMYFNDFDELLDLVQPYISKMDTNYRRPIGAEERLAVCLRYLATGDAFTTIGFSYRMGTSTVADIVVETCEVIWNVLVDTYLPQPSKELWVYTAERFAKRWNFPNCIGAIDGKHVVMQAPPNSGSVYFNYKGTFSIVLMAMVDADYCFTIVDIGSYGSNSDGGIFRDSPLSEAFETGNLYVPPPKVIPRAEDIGEMPHVIVGDPAFPLKSFLMKPYPGTNLDNTKIVFNYRLSRARRMVENVFGILAQRWRIYQRRIQLNPERAIKVIKATCALHNYLEKRNFREDDIDENGMPILIQAANTQGLTNIQPSRISAGNRSAREATQIRDHFADYFMSQVGAIRSQHRLIRK